MVVQFAQGLSLADKARDGIGGAGHHLRSEDFDGDEFPGGDVPPPVHVAHAAPAEQVAFGIDDLEMVADSLTCARSRCHTRNIARGGLDRGLGPL